MATPQSLAEHLLIWVHSGRASVRLADDAPRELAAGDGIWLPAGTVHQMWTEPGSLAFPILVSPHAVVGAPTSPASFRVEHAWTSWLVAHFALPFTTYNQVQPEELMGLLGRSGREPRPLASEAPNPGQYPPMPATPAARRVASELLRNPALDHTLERWADWAASSATTLRRDFVSSTDLTFTQWRTRCRLAAASEYLAAGYGVSEAAVRSGFASRNGLTRAFQHQHGLTPREFAARALARGGEGPSRRVVADRAAGAIGDLLAQAPSPPRRVPAGRNPARVAPYHVLTWIYRGSGRARVASRTFERGRGDALWLPAGVERETSLAEGSLSLPIGVLDADEVDLTEPYRAHFSPAWDPYLLHCAVSANTMLRPDGYRPTDMLAVFGDHLAHQRAAAVPMPKDRLARAAATAFLRHLGTGTGTGTDSDPDGLSPEVRQAFRRETGMTFAAWCHAARMRIARDLLAAGTRPSTVAARVGYAHLSNFSRAFRQFHGISARDHQERELGGQDGVPD